ncbi:MAG: hypothetical protein WA802_11425 [Terracidiphilus sp.]
MAKCTWIVGTFAAMYLIATIVGFATYLLISPLIMWIFVFTLMPVVSALLIYWYLLKMRISRQASLKETFYLVLTWIGLSFGFDAATYIFIIPTVSHTSPDWTFFRDQSQGIWLSYAVLLVC